ncbi:MAG: hypothetical protein FJ253_09450, partial [Phycisphaerae bacterium]|nr:hypothetical protein [Phycisphaerae bacterium]
MRTSPRANRLHLLAIPLLAVAAVTSVPAPMGGLGSFADAAPQSDIEAARQRARDAMKDGKWVDAIDAWTVVLTSVPGDPEALAGIREAESRRDEASQIDDVQQDIQLRQDRLKVEFGSDMDRAQQQLRNGDYGGAKRSVLTAKVKVERERGILSQAYYDDLTKQADTLLQQIATAEEAALSVRQQQERQDATKDAQEARKKEREKRQKTIDELLIRVRQLQLEMKYGEALQVLDQILFMDPGNPSAMALHDIIETTMMYTKYSDVMKRRSVAYAGLAREAQNAAVPPRVNVSGPGDKSVQALIVYPEDWPDITNMRPHYSSAGWQEPERNRPTFHELQTKQFPANFNKNPFETVVAYLRQVTGLDFYVDWKGLDEIGVRPEDEITLEMPAITGEQALRRILEQLGDENSHPEWAVEDGQVVISTRANLNKRVVTIVYDIRDLIFEIPY